MQTPLEVSVASTFLASSASVSVGILSVAGMAALFPGVPAVILPTLFLSTAYEGEIILQNVTESLNTLYTNDHVKRAIAKRYLWDHFPHDNLDVHPFFKEYQDTQMMLDFFKHMPLRKHETLPHVESLQNKIQAMDTDFMDRLFTENASVQDKFQEWLNTQAETDRTNNTKTVHEQLKTLNSYLSGINIFSALAAGCMMIGNLFLLAEAFQLVPWLMFIPLPLWPTCILPIAIFASMAYGLVIRNAFTGIMLAGSGNQFIDHLHKNFKWDLTHLGFGLLSFITIALTCTFMLCTIGTWLTILSAPQTLFLFLNHLPPLFFHLIIPGIIGLASFIFNIQNSLQTLIELGEWMESPWNPDTWYILTHPIETCLNTLWWMSVKENPLQLMNPARLLLAVLEPMLCTGLFGGHVLSESVNVDRVPGFTALQVASANGLLSWMQDTPYFFNLSADDHSPQKLLEAHLLSAGGHSHEDNIPAKCIKALLTPLHVVDFLWDWSASFVWNVLVNLACTDHHLGYDVVLQANESDSPQELVLDKTEEGQLYYRVKNTPNARYLLNGLPTAIQEALAQKLDDKCTLPLSDNIIYHIFTVATKNKHYPKQKTRSHEKEERADQYRAFLTTHSIADQKPWKLVDTNTATEPEEITDNNSNIVPTLPDTLTFIPPSSTSNNVTEVNIPIPPPKRAQHPGHRPGDGCDKGFFSPKWEKYFNTRKEDSTTNPDDNKVISSTVGTTNEM